MQVNIAAYDLENLFYIFSTVISYILSNKRFKTGKYECIWDLPIADVCMLFYGWKIYDIFCSDLNL